MESMNNKDPFETFLEKQSFSEKASESLHSRLEKSASFRGSYDTNRQQECLRFPFGNSRQQESVFL